MNTTIQPVEIYGYHATKLIAQPYSAAAFTGSVARIDIVQTPDADGIAKGLCVILDEKGLQDLKKAIDAISFAK